MIILRTFETNGTSRVYPMFQIQSALCFKSSGVPYVSNPWEWPMFQILGSVLCFKSLGVLYVSNPWECPMFQISGVPYVSNP